MPKLFSGSRPATVKIVSGRVKVFLLVMGWGARIKRRRPIRREARTMAQALRWRPAIEVRPQDARIAQFLGFTVRQAKPCFAVSAERAGMVERVGVDGEAFRACRESARDRAVKQPGADAAADIGKAEAEKGKLDRAAFAAVQLKKADQPVL